MASHYKTLTLTQQLRFVFILFCILLGVEILNILTGRGLSQFGTLPRTIVGLRGILFSPFLHGSILHFSANIVPFCLFTWLMLQYGVKRYVYSSAFIILVTGLLVWLFARSAMHIGASGTIYGYFGFLVIAGFLSGRIKLLLISLVVGFFYGGLIFGVVPSNPYVSWESHLFGFISGAVAAILWARSSH